MTAHPATLLAAPASDHVWALWVYFGAVVLAGLLATVGAALPVCARLMRRGMSAGRPGRVG